MIDVGLLSLLWVLPVYKSRRPLWDLIISISRSHQQTIIMRIPTVLRRSRPANEPSFMNGIPDDIDLHVIYTIAAIHSVTELTNFMLACPAAATAFAACGSGSLKKFVIQRRHRLGYQIAYTQKPN